MSIDELFCVEAQHSSVRPRLLPLSWQSKQRLRCTNISNQYGPVAPVKDEATGLELIQLPAGFKYWSYGWTGDPMDDGTPTPAMHDGMGIIRSFGRWLVLCRNHEVDEGKPFMPIAYSTGAGGGNSNLVFDLKTERFVSSFPTLSGTFRNCARRNYALGNLVDLRRDHHGDGREAPWVRLRCRSARRFAESAEEHGPLFS